MKMKSEKKYCNAYCCPYKTSCNEHPANIPKKQKTAIFLNKAGTCRRYIIWLVSNKVIEGE